MVGVRIQIAEPPLSPHHTEYQDPALDVRLAAVDGCLSSYAIYKDIEPQHKGAGRTRTAQATLRAPVQTAHHAVTEIEDRWQEY